MLERIFISQVLKINLLHAITQQENSKKLLRFSKNLASLVKPVSALFNHHQSTVLPYLEQQNCLNVAT